MAVSLMGIPVADEPKDSVMWKEADAFMSQMSLTLQHDQRKYEEVGKCKKCA